MMGNHEDMMIKYLSDYHGDGWLYNGGNSTLDQFNQISTENKKYLELEISKLPLYREIEVNGQKFILSHAGVEFSEDGKLKKRDRNFILWAREEFIYDMEVPNDTICIFGHTPTKMINGKFTMWHGTNKVCIDCGAVFKAGKLACLRLDDMEEFYI